MRNTIKITGWAFQGDDVVVDVDYDLEGADYSFTVTAPMTVVLGYTEAQIKTWLKNNVANRRGQQLRDQVEALLTPLRDVDVEV